MTVFFILKCSGRHSKKDFLLPNRKSFSSQLLQLPISSRTVSPELKSSCGLVAKLCLTLCNPMDHSPPGSSVHGILQARTLEWAAISSIKPSGSIQIQYASKVGRSTVGQRQDNSESWYLFQSSLPGGARLCQTYITILLLPPPNSASSSFPSQLLILSKYTIPQTLSQHLPPLNPTYNKHLLCLSGRHPNHKLSASPRWDPVHTLISFPRAAYALVLAKLGYFLWEQGNLRD